MTSFTDTLPLGALWDREASYKYYQHGPLARTEIGHYRVQGMDYAYTLQGWIKGLNASFLNPGRDMGRDAQNVSTNPNRYTAADAFAYTLGFYNAVNDQSSSFINDYYAIAGTSGQFEINYPTSSDVPPFHTDAPSQFTGNIRFIAKQTRDITPNGASIQTYRYDQLMRLNAMNTYFPGSTALASWNIRATGFTAPLQANYKESNITYDRNGNILSYQRWGASTSLIQDNLAYSYTPGTNKLSHVSDASGSSTSGEVLSQSSDNYSYDGAGNLASDAQSFINPGDITWSPYGKILQVNVLSGLAQNIFGYDAMQNRVKKRKVNFVGDISTYYIRDAQGNVLAVYEKNGTTVTWKEQHLYGSSRLGTVEPGVAWTSTPGTAPYFRGTQILPYGWKRYEINDHLGNVRALINDRKTYISAVFQPTTIQATDYFPFGAEMRKGTGATAYRYGFNGKELDKNGEFGSLNHYDYGFRIYNPGIGRFLSVDPLTGDYPELTPYQFASNTPIQAIDLDGLEMYYAANGNYLGRNGSSTEIRIIGRDDVAEKAKNNLVHSNWDHKWLEEYSTKAYENTKANQHTVLSNWARQHRTRDVERAMSLYTLKINSPDGKGQIEVFVEGTTVVAPPRSSDGGGGMVNPLDSRPMVFIPNAKRSTTIHTHPAGDALEFSNEARGLYGGGDIQYAMRFGVDIYLVPPAGNEMGKFSPDLYMQLLRAQVEKGEWGHYWKKAPDSELIESGNPRFDANKPLVEAAKQRVQIEEPK